MKNGRIKMAACVFVRNVRGMHWARFCSLSSFSVLLIPAVMISSFTSASAGSSGGYSVQNMQADPSEPQYCSFFNNRAPTRQPMLKNCSMFKENSCCLQQEIDATFNKVKPLQGASRDCQIHMNYLMCYICAPNQHMFYSRERLTVCVDFCDALYEACKSAILKGSVIRNLYPNGRKFCLSRSFEVAPPEAKRCFRYYNQKDKNSSKNVAYNMSAIYVCLVFSIAITSFLVDQEEKSTNLFKNKNGKSSEVKYKLFHKHCSKDKNQTVMTVQQYQRFQSPCLLNRLPLLGKIMFLCLFLLILPTCVQCIRPSDIHRWAQKISDDFSAFTEEGLQFDAIQKAYYGAEYDTEMVDGGEKLMEVKGKLETFFSKKKKIAEELSKKVAELYDNWSSSSPPPSHLFDLPRDVYKDSDLEETIPYDQLVYSSDFNLPVLHNSSTVKIPDDVSRTDPGVINDVVLTSKLDEHFQQNARLDPALRWQYFGSSHGVLRQFPGRVWQSNFIGFKEDYDPRLRPWYIAATSGPKDIVLILDGSSSMNEHEGFAKIQKVAKTILGTLSQQDHINVITSRSNYFEGKSNQVERRPEVLSCSGDRLLQATLNTRKSIMANIQNMKLDGGSDHRDAFTKAFELLNGPSKSGCQSIIIFVTDGDPRDQDLRCDAGYYRYDSESRRRYIPGDFCYYDFDIVVEHVEKLQKYRKELVSIFTFVTNKKNLHFPKKLSCNNKGMWLEIADDDAIYKQLTPYFDLIISQSTSRDVVWTSPYIDKSGLGLTLSAAMPVYSNKTGKYLGVVAIDASLTNVERLLSYEAWGSTYAFLIDDEATAVVHPFVKPSAQLLEDTIYTNIFKLETHNGKPAEFNQVVKQVLQEKTGDYTIRRDARRAVSFENALYWRSVDYTRYLFTHIDGSQFYLMFNIAEGDNIKRYAKPPSSYGTTFLYDLVGYLQLQKKGKLTSLVMGLNITKNLKKYPDVPITMTASLVQLAPRCFCDPDAYVRENKPSLLQIHDDVNQPASYLSEACPRGPFQSGVRKLKIHVKIFRLDAGNLTFWEIESRNLVYDRRHPNEATRADIHLTGKPEEKWKTRDKAIQDQIVWTYIGTSSGILRIFPGTALDKTYDTVRRPWYNIALINRGKLAISKVYLDASRIGKVVTFSKNVHKGPDIDPGRSTCGVYPFGDGCQCSSHIECKSEFCYEKRCASHQIQGVMALDLFYHHFYAKVTSILSLNENKTVCGSRYSCRYGASCETRCFLLDGSANLVLDQAFLDVQNKDRHLYEDVSLASKHGHVFQQLLTAGIYKRNTRMDYQAVCTVSGQNSNENWNSPMDLTTMSPNETGPIPPFQNKYGCVKEVAYYVVNETALINRADMIHGSLSSDPCAYGDYYFRSIPGTNLFLLILDNYVERRTFYNFNCHIENSALKPGSYPPEKNICAMDNKNIFKNITTVCPARRAFVDVCAISAAKPTTLSVFFYIPLLFCHCCIVWPCLMAKYYYGGKRNDKVEDLKVT